MNFVVIGDKITIKYHEQLIFLLYMPINRESSFDVNNSGNFKYSLSFYHSLIVDTYVVYK